MTRHPLWTAAVVTVAAVALPSAQPQDKPKVIPSFSTNAAPAAERVLQHAAQETDRLLHDYVGTEHLLLGLLSEQGSVAADVLTSRSLRLDRMRQQIVELLSEG